MRVGDLYLVNEVGNYVFFFFAQTKHSHYFIEWMDYFNDVFTRDV